MGFHIGHVLPLYLTITIQTIRADTSELQATDVMEPFLIDRP